MSQFVTSTLSISFPPPQPVSVTGISSEVMNQVQPGATSYFSTLGGASIASALTGRGQPLPQQTNLNERNYFPALLSSGVVNVGGHDGRAVRPIVNLPFLNNASINPAFQH